MEKNYKYIIYQTINIVNNKIYIGRHRTENPEIFDGYIGNGVNINYPSTYMNPKYAFQYAVKKYGTSSFRRSILFIFDTEEEALLKEEEIVNADFINRPDTYNMIIGGGGKKPAGYSVRKVYQFDTKGNLVKEWNNCYDVAEFFNTWKETIYTSIKLKHRYLNYYWSYDNSINLNEYSSPNFPTKTYKYNKNGKLVEIYDSMYVAAKENGYKLCELSNRIKEKALTKGFYYDTKLVDEYIPRPKLSIAGKTLYLYTPDGKYYTSMKTEDIMKKFDVANRKIAYIIKTHALINKEYLISTVLEDSIEPYKGRIKSTKILLFDSTGNLIDTCESITQASKKYNLDAHNIRCCLRGTRKTVKGFIIKEVI